MTRKTVLIAAGVACAGVLVAAQSSSGPRIDPKRITAHVQVLASDEFEGRAPGSRGETKTVEYLMRELTAAGIEPGGDVVAGRRQWTQDVPLVVSEIGELDARFDVRDRSVSLRQGDEITVLASHRTESRVSLKAAPLYVLGRQLASSRTWPHWLEGSEFKGRRDATAAARK